jgi:hypothetical protein
MDAPSGFERAILKSVKLYSYRGASMTNITTIGLDLAKMIFQVHGDNPNARVV